MSAMTRRCSCFRFDSCREIRAKNAIKGSTVSKNSSIYSREMTVRVIHAGGREEMYQNAILVSHIIGKYPGMCLAKPEVFKNPNGSLLSSEEVLLPGQKYLLIPSTTIGKLTRKHSQNMESAEGDELSDTSLCSGDFGKNSPKKQLRKKHVSPIRKQSTRRGIMWEPSLMSIEEISP